MRDKIKWFWRYYRHFPYVLAVLLILTPIQAMVQAYAPRLLQFSIDYRGERDSAGEQHLRMAVLVGLQS